MVPGWNKGTIADVNVTSLHTISPQGNEFHLGRVKKVFLSKHSPTVATTSDFTPPPSITIQSNQLYLLVKAIQP